MASKFIERVDDGVQFYTHVFTGVSGMSESGLIRLCGAPRSTVKDLLRDLVVGNPRSDCLNPFAGKGIWLSERGPNNAKIIRDEVCAAVVEHYAYEAQSKTEEAIFAYRKFGSFGVRVWIQRITGWDGQYRKQRLLEGFVDQAVRNRDSCFKDDFYKMLYRKRGGAWVSRDPKSRPGCVGTWTNEVVYERLTDGLKEELRQVNPKVNGRTKNRDYCHLKDFGADRLDAHFYALQAISNLCPDGDWDMFKRFVQRAFPHDEETQLHLLDLLQMHELAAEAS
jgi:hypothetical protein